MSADPTGVVLVVDDSDEARYVTSERLRRAGYAVIEASSGLAGIRAAQAQPQVIVLDVKLPDISGFEVCQRLRADPATTQIPILHLSAACPDDASQVAGLTGGADAYLTQPVDPSLLLAHVGALARTGRAVRALAESERRFRTLFEASADGLLLFDPIERRITDCNGALCHLLGYTREELLRIDVAALAPEVFAGAIDGLVEETLAGLQQVPDLTLLRKDGAERKVQVSAAVLEVGGRTSLLGALRDVTERNEARERMARSERLASVGLLAAGVAHELNNPLAWVLYNLQSMGEDVDQLLPLAAGDVALRLAALRSKLSATEEGAKRMRGVVRELQTFAHPERRERVPVDLRAVIRAAAVLATNEIRFRARLELALDEPLPVLGSDARLSQVFLNLLVRAARAGDEGHPERNLIRVRGWCTPGEVHVELSDSGPGLAPEALKRIFEPFADAARSGEWAGLDLAICHRLVEEHGGRIEAWSQPERGTRFQIHLPRVAGEDQAGRASAPAPQPSAPTTRLRLLLVDDEPHLVRALTLLLERAGHAVTGAGSGREAQALLEQRRDWDVVLCDVMMPDLMGMDLHAWLAERDPELARRFLFLTGGTFSPRAQDYLARLGNPVIHKPIERQRLLDALRDMAAGSGSVAPEGG